MTSNAGSNLKGSAMGFEKTEGDFSKERAMKALSEFLRPEFLARIDEVVQFNHLTEQDYQKIAALMLNELKKPLSNRGIKFGYDQSALELIAKKAHGQKSGARDIRKVIRREVEDKLTALIVDTVEAPPALISVVAKGETLELITA